MSRKILCPQVTRNGAISSELVFDGIIYRSLNNVSETSQEFEICLII